MKIISFIDEFSNEANTEYYAYQQMKLCKIKNENTCYLAFPWSDFFNKKISNSQLASLNRNLNEFKEYISKKNYVRVITVCEHKNFEEAIKLSDNIGVTDLFFSHLDCEHRRYDRVNTFPFPFYAPNIDVEEKIWAYTYITKENIFLLKNFNEGNQAQKLSGFRKYDAISKSKFTVIEGTYEEHIEDIWKAINCESIPVISSGYLAPRHDHFFSKFSLIVSHKKDSLQTVHEKLHSMQENDYITRLENLKAYKILYNQENIVNDIVEIAVSEKSPTSNELELLDSILFKAFYNYINKIPLDVDLVSKINSFQSNSFLENEKIDLLRRILIENRKMGS
ncbi:hypothetical protein [Salinimonas sediminis]|uniref:Glycosyltransferase family 1 protein n=1 Tax=Salinimonas sediminis TaxID=2303538 RepID=A0A346NQN7_9ALTE|nr:hypothetical protein [Salinimonas sediminis]AXR07844.1 hypothetical protein D0Y50_16660 [Salinimonas sediminis]